jgi:cell division protein FtsQ
VLGALFVLVAGSLLALNSPLFELGAVTVRGTRVLSREAVVSASGVALGTKLWRVEPGRVARALLELPRVASASVQRLWPDRLLVTVVERTSLVLAPLLGQWLEVAEDGAVLEVHAAPPAASPDGPVLPVLEGLEAGQLGRLPADAKPEAVWALGGLGFLRRRELAVERARLGPRALEVVLADGTELFLGAPDADLKARAQDAAAILEELSLLGRKAARIDVSVRGKPVIRPR